MDSEIKLSQFHNSTSLDHLERLSSFSRYILTHLDGYIPMVTSTDCIVIPLQANPELKFRPLVLYMSFLCVERIKKSRHDRKRRI